MFGLFKKKEDGETAISNAIAGAYPGAEQLRFATPQARQFQLAGVIAALIEGPVPYWVIVSRGLTELGKKEEKDRAVSGWGFELTCRVPARFRTPEQDFGWVLSWMQGLADYLAESGSFFAPFHNKQLVEPQSADDTCALVFVDDVALHPTGSTNGKFSFLQMVGLTSDEHQALEAWDARAFVELLRLRNPTFLTDPERMSYLRDEAFAKTVKAGRERDGSSVGMLSGVPILWFQEASELQIHLGTETVETIRFALHHRLRHGNLMVLLGDPRRREGAEGAVVGHAQVNVVLMPEDGVSQVEERNGMKAAALRIGPEAIVQLLETLDSRPHSYAVPALPGVRFIVADADRFGSPHYPW